MADRSLKPNRKFAQAKSHEYSIVSSFPNAYRNREDVTNLAPGILIKGSKNVLTNVSERVQIRQGYRLDGLVNYIAAPIVSSFDWLTKNNGEMHMRAGRLSDNTNGLLQYRFVPDANGVLGDNLVTNGTFTGNADGWSVYDGSYANLGSLPADGWSYNANDVIHDGSAAHTGSLGQQLGLSPLTHYHVKFVVGGTTGQIFFYLNGTAAFGPYAAGSTVDNEFISGAYNSGDGDGLFLIAPSSDFDGTIDGVGLNQVLESGKAYWKNLLTGLSTVSYNFAKFFNITEGVREVLFVDGTSNIFEWNGANAVVSATTVNTITKTGTLSWEDEGFYAVGNKSIEINGNTYTYTGGENTTTLTGVTPDPTGEPNSSIVQQSVITTANSAMSTIPATFPNSLISTLNNQVFVGATNSSALYISYINDFKNYAQSTPRQTGEGALLILDDNLVALIPQENYMYVTAGQDLWYNVNFEVQTSTVGVTYEQVNALPLKTGRRQAPFSQAFVSHMKNNVIVVTQETTIDTFGRAETSLATPQTTNISDSIKLDIDGYDFTDGSIAYWRYYILVAVPREGLILMYSLATNSWEAPQTIPVSRFYIVDGELYGHSYNTFESYQLFTGYADRVDVGFEGFPIQAVWRFSYQNYGSRFSLKRATKMYVEGYIDPNTKLKTRLIYELDGCQTIREFTLDGANTQFVCIAPGDGALGKDSLGKLKLGGDQVQSINNLPPKFRWFPTFNPKDFFECSVEFSVLGTNNRAEILAFGLAVGGSTQIPTGKMD